MVFKKVLSGVLSAALLLSVFATTSLAATNGIFIDDKNFPDKIFRDYVYNNFDLDKDYALSDDECSAVTSISMYSKGVADITGVAYFPNLTALVMNENQLTSVDLSNNTKVKKIYLQSNKLTSINISGLSQLTDLNLDNNQLTSVNLSTCTALSTLSLSSNQIASVDLSSLTSLTSLQINNNKLTSLNTSKNLKLATLECAYNYSLGYISVSHLANLTRLYCAGCGLKSIDVSKLTKLEVLDCGMNTELTKLDVSKNVKLKELYCNYGKLTSMDFSNNPLMETISLPCNALTSIKINNCPNLKKLYLGANLLKSVDISNNMNIYLLLVDHNMLSSIDVKNHSQLCYLGISDNKISSVDITGTKIPAYLGNYILDKGAFVFSDDFNYMYYGFNDGTKTIHCKDMFFRVDPSVQVTTGTSYSYPKLPSTVLVNNVMVDSFAERLYTTCMGRTSDPAGKGHWITQLQSGMSGADVAKQFFFSKEFIDFDLSDEDYVKRLYLTFMDREADQGGLDHWTSQLAAGQTREYVFYGFVNSQEWANVCLDAGIVSGGSAVSYSTKEPSAQTKEFATRLYTTCLQRDADPVGLDYWAKELANMRKSGTDVAFGFFFSQELTNKNIDDNDFITRLYRTFMGREPDDAGFSFWQTELANSDRKTIFYRFAACGEFANICSDAGIIR